MLQTTHISPFTRHQIQQALSFIQNEIENLGVQNRQRGRTAKSKASLAFSIRTLVRNALGAQSLQKDGEARIAKSPNGYTRGPYNRHLSYRIHVQLAYAGLIELGYLIETKKGVAEDGVGLYQTKYIASDKLHDLIGPIQPALLSHLIELGENADLIRVQLSTKAFTGKKAKPTRQVEKIEYEDTDTTRTMRENLSRINALIGRARIDLEIQPTVSHVIGLGDGGFSENNDEVTDLSRVSLHRVFSSNSFNRGGRFYGAWWQNCLGYHRQHITINGKQTVECDFSNLHPSMLYHERCLEPSEDAYAGIIGLTGSSNSDFLFSESAARSLVKKAFNAMMNAKTELKRPPQELHPKDFGLTWSQLSQRILQKHHAIADAFYTGQGLRLQFIDSQLAEQIMLHFARKDIPALPVHDSFIICADYQNKLIDVMKRAFGERFDGADIKVTVK